MGVTVAKMLNGRINKLQRKHAEYENDPQDFAGAAACQPFLHPRENHAREEKIQRGKRHEHDKRPEKQGRSRQSEPYPHREEPDNRGDRTRIKKSVDKAENQKAAEAQREA